MRMESALCIAKEELRDSYFPSETQHENNCVWQSDQRLPPVQNTLHFDQSQVCETER